MVNEEANYNNKNCSADNLFFHFSKKSIQRDDLTFRQFHEIFQQLQAAGFSPINFPAMADAMHAHDADDIRNFINHPIVADATPPVVSYSR